MIRLGGGLCNEGAGLCFWELPKRKVFAGGKADVPHSSQPKDSSCHAARQGVRQPGASQPSII